jgi:hypothetical protein
MFLLSFNRDTISVAFLGNYMFYDPDIASIASLEHLLSYVMTNSWVTENFTLMAMCEVRNTLSPGKKLYDELIKIYDNCNSSSKILYQHICAHLVSSIADDNVCTTADLDQVFTAVLHCRAIV